MSHRKKEPSNALILNIVSIKKVQNVIDNTELSLRKNALKLGDEGSNVRYASLLCYCLAKIIKDNPTFVKINIQKYASLKHDQSKWQEDFFASMADSPSPNMLKLLASTLYWWIEMNHLYDSIFPLIIYNSSDEKDQINELYRSLSQNTISRREKSFVFPDKPFSKLTFEEKAYILIDDGKEITDLSNFHCNLLLIWPDLKVECEPSFLSNSSNEEIQKEIINHIFMQAEKYPLISYYLNKDNIAPYIHEIHNLIVTSVFPGEIIIQKIESNYVSLFRNSEMLPLTKNLISWIDSKIEKCCHGTFLTPHDLLVFLEYCAFLSSNNDVGYNAHPYFSFSEVTDLLRENSLFANNEYLEHLLSVCKGVFIKEASLSEGTVYYHFCIKQYRLILLSSYLSKNKVYNSVNDLYKDIRHYSKVMSSIAEDNNYSDIEITCKNRYDSIVLFSTSFVLSLNESMRNEFIDFLCSLAENFSHKARENQTIAIYILSNLLIECKHYLSFEQREKIFFVSFGTTSFDFQVKLYELIRPSSSYYHLQIKQQYETACSIDKETGFACAQPYFFFLYHTITDFQHTELKLLAKKSFKDTFQFINDKLQRDKNLSFFDNNIESTAFFLRDYTWRIYNGLTAVPDNSELRNLLSCLFKCIRYLSINGIEHYEEDILRISSIAIKNSYVFQALLYSIANVMLFNTDTHLIQSISNSFYECNFLKCLFYFDYISRASNSVYQSLRERQLRDSDKLYLLCGTHRFISTADKYEFFTKNEYHLSEEMYVSYYKWLENESGRYRVLLGRLLSFSDFFNPKEHPTSNTLLESIFEQILSGNITDSHFLNYDCISIENIIKALQETPSRKIPPKNWYRTYGNNN